MTSPMPSSAVNTAGSKLMTTTPPKETAIPSHRRQPTNSLSTKTDKSVANGTLSCTPMAMTEILSEIPSAANMKAKCAAPMVIATITTRTICPGTILRNGSSTTVSSRKRQPVSIIADSSSTATLPTMKLKPQTRQTRRMSARCGGVMMPSALARLPPATRHTVSQRRDARGWKWGPTPPSSALPPA